MLWKTPVRGYRVKQGNLEQVEASSRRPTSHFCPSRHLRILDDVQPSFCSPPTFAPSIPPILPWRLQCRAQPASQAQLEARAHLDALGVNALVKIVVHRVDSFRTRRPFAAIWKRRISARHGPRDTSASTSRAKQCQLPQ